MTTPKTGANLQTAKRVIAQKSKEFEARLMKAKNAFEQVLILNEMQELIEAEIFAWTNIVTENSDDEGTPEDSIVNDACVHVAELNDFIDTLNKNRAGLMPDALKIQRAMINSHLLSEPKIIEKN